MKGLQNHKVCFGLFVKIIDVYVYVDYCKNIAAVNVFKVGINEAAATLVGA